MVLTTLAFLLFGSICGIAAWIAATHRERQPRRRAEKHLRVMELSLTNASTAIFIADLRKQTISTTSVGAQLVGLPSDRIAITNAEWFALMPPEDCERANQIGACG